MPVEFHQCPHESDGIDQEVTVPNFFALTGEEIKELLQMVIDDRSPEMAAKVARRMMQGIKGVTCPPQETGPIAKRINEVGYLLSKFQCGRRRLNQELVDEFERILDY